MGFDVSISTCIKPSPSPHGGGGPGAVPVGVKKHLMPFMPVPVLVERNGMIELDYDRPESFGRVKSFYGNFGVIVKAYAYIRSPRRKGLKEASENAVLNANYIMNALRGTMRFPTTASVCMNASLLRANCSISAFTQPISQKPLSIAVTIPRPSTSRLSFMKQ